MAACAAAAFALGAAPALAAGDSLSFATSPTAPSGITPFTVTVSGSTSAGSEQLIIAIEPATKRCPSDYATYSGPTVIKQTITGTGPFPTITSAPSSEFEHGHYLICGALVSAGMTTFSTQLPLAVSDPDTISIAAPASVTDGLSATVSVDGAADVQRPVVYMTRKPAGKRGCAASPGADSGTLLAPFDPAPASYGGFRQTTALSLGAGPSGHTDEEPPGDYELCAWLMDSQGSKTVPLAGPTSATVALLAPTGTLAFSLPELVSAGHRFSVAMSYASPSTDVGLYLDLVPLGAHGSPCAATRAAQRGVVRAIYSNRGGKRTVNSLELQRVGVYVACAWLEWPHGTIDGPFAGRLVVAGPHQRSTLYYGVTSQHLPRSKLASNYPIVFRVIDGQIVNLAYFAQFTCTRAGKPATHPIYSTSFPAFGLRSRREFGYTFVQGTDHASVSGLFGRRDATGTLSESYTSGGYLCRSGSVTFTARRG